MVALKGQKLSSVVGLMPFQDDWDTPGLPRTLPWAMGSLAFQAVLVPPHLRTLAPTYLRTLVPTYLRTLVSPSLRN